MMAVRYFALILGIIFLLVGILGFVPGITQMHPAHPALTVEGPGHGYLLGMFHVNVLHNLVHIGFGIWGILAYAAFSQARLYAQVVAIGYGLLAVMGLIPGLNTLWGIMPLHGHVVWLHALIALAAAYFAFVPVRATERPVYETTPPPPMP